ncbi:MAG TPA: threonine/serine dehydratase [Bryobacteraceae bacterium]
MSAVLTLGDVQQARQRIASCVRRTPLVPSATLSERFKTNVYVKLELFQKTGSFKVRGTFNKALSLAPETHTQGLATISGGNHALAVAYTAQALDLKAILLMPENAPPPIVEAVRGYGADLRFAASAPEAFAQAAELERDGWVYIHPFDDPVLMAGQGTVALEILDDVPQVTDIVLSIGGGGLMAGVGTVIKALKPMVRIWGVETQGADSMSRSLAAGKIVTLDAMTSVARSLGAPAPSERTFGLAQQFLESVTVVSDKDALDAARLILDRMKVLAEPAAACTLAAAARLQGQFSPGKHVVLLLSGGNVSLESLMPVS